MKQLLLNACLTLLLKSKIIQFYVNGDPWLDWDHIGQYQIN